MKITFLGTSHGVPSPDRACSSFLLESGDVFYLIDAGAPVAQLLQCYQKNMNDLRAVFTTHTHSDHTAGIPQLVSLMTWYYRESSADFYFTEQPFADAVEHLITVADARVPRDRIRFRLIDPATDYEDENIRIQYIPTRHMGGGRPSYALLVREGEHSVLFGGDFSGGLKKEDVPTILAEEEIDAFICELAHFGVAELTPYLERCRAKAVYPRIPARKIQRRRGDQGTLSLPRLHPRGRRLHPPLTPKTTGAASNAVAFDAAPVLHCDRDQPTGS